MTRPATILRILPAALLLLGACASTGGGAAAYALGGTSWRLESLGGQPAIPTEGPNAARLFFEAGATPDSGRAFGGASCNRFNGPYTASGGTLRFGALVSTRMACADERLNRQEVAFLGALDATRTFRVAGDTLVLEGEAGAVARLVAIAGD